MKESRRDKSHSSHKHKKKKKKKTRRRSSSTSDSESQGSEMKNVVELSKNPGVEKRESCMNDETFLPRLSKSEMKTVSRSHQKRIDSLSEQQEKDDKIKKERELNPHWKNDGTGLPDKEPNVESLSLPSTSVGDGGYSWLKKAYLRIQEQAQQEGRSMEDVAVERWGSLQKLVSMIEEAEARMKMHPDQKLNYRDRYEQRYHRATSDRFKKPCEYESNFSFEYKKPSDSREQKKNLNQFKSSRKSNSYDYPQSKDFTKSSERRKLTEVKSHDSVHGLSSLKDCIPVWKKPRRIEEKLGDHEVNSIDKICSTSVTRDIEKNTESDEIPVMYSEEDLNKLVAQQIKAEIMGDSSFATKLKQQVEKARNIIKEKGFAQKPPKQVEEVILTKLDSHGQARPIQASQEDISDYKHSKSKKYFDDGNRYSLKQMFEREKLTTVNDQMEMFVEASAKCDDSAEIDFEIGNVSKKLSQKMAAGREDEKDIGKAIRQHQKHTAALEKCVYCLDQPNMKKYLIIDIGEEVYLCLPNYQSITEGHCLIVPKPHVSSFLSLDENEWREVDLFKSHLRNLFRSQNKSVIFLETSMYFRYHPHAVLECIPVPEEEGDMAPLYFKKAIQESEAEWAHNKKLIDLRNKGLRHSVPKNLPYFHVEFDPKIHAGYAHVIEEEKCFPHNFGKEVVGGMLDIDYNHLYKNKKEDPLKKSKEVVEFEKMWKKFKTENS